MSYPSRLPGTRPSLVEHSGNPEGHKNVLLPEKSQILQTTGAQMEQRSPREHFPGKETARTKTRGPLEGIHSLRTHNHLATGGE